MRLRSLFALALVAAAPPPSTSGYQPSGADEQGLWAEMAEFERALGASKLLVHNPALLGYLERVLCRTVGTSRCRATRLYLVRDPRFNASMAPNGAMIVHTGLLLRVRSEAELAAVLGHEFSHFEERHSLANWRSARRTTNAVAFMSVLPASYALAPLMLVAGHFAFSRDQERAADLGGLAAMRRAGYRAGAAADLWEHLRAEMDATGAARKTRSRKDDRGLFATHPAEGDRMSYLRAAAADDRAGEDGADRYRAAVGPIWPMLVDDQIKRQDFGGSEYLLAALAQDGWTGPLLHARGELYRTRAKHGDLEAAAGFYREAIARDDAPAEAWRGLGLALARAGDRDGARAVLGAYLQRRPDAPDRAMLASIGGLE